ncbi:hypothetical protein [Devosia sp. MC1541]|uniref:hypothetical protein n=1 Tax=Devosia sp. MC1541 TaxID=2725264 RepID=UPI00145F77CD|nr:hypothetical protein [Devosia sp. MC1541]
MKIDRRITNGLAWTGALLVVAIPSADFITRQFMPDVGSSVAVVSEVRAPAATSAPAAVSAPASPVVEARQEVAEAPKASAPAAAQSGDVVDNFLNSGRALPDYISGGGSAPAAKPAAQPETQPVAAKPAVPASIQPAQQAVEKPAPKPVPAPVAVPVATPPAAPAPAPAVVATVPKVVGFPTPAWQRPPSVEVASTPPLIIDTPPIHSQTVIRPSDNRVIRLQDNRVIRPEELDEMEEWEAGPVQDFLNQRGSRATVRRQQIVPPNAVVPPANVGGGNDYVPGGFFFDQGPANAQPRGFPLVYDGRDIPEYEVYPLN